MVSVGWSVEWLVGWMAIGWWVGWSVGQSGAWLFGHVIGFGWWVGWLVGWVGWLVCWVDEWFSCWFAYSPLPGTTNRQTTIIQKSKKSTHKNPTLIPPMFLGFLRWSLAPRSRAFEDSKQPGWVGLAVGVEVAWDIGLRTGA